MDEIGECWGLESLKTPLDLLRFATESETKESTQESGRELDSSPCLLDCLTVTLRDMDVISGEWQGDGELLNSTTLLPRKCTLDLAVRRNLDSTFNHSSPNICVRGSLSATSFR